MNDTTPREPRGTIAKRTVRPRQPWEAVYESYTPTEEPLPLTELALLLFAEGMIWLDGGAPDLTVLCQVIAQTDPGAIEEDIDDPDTTWRVLVSSLEGLAWGSGPHMRQAFQACCAILNHVESKDEEREALTRLTSTMIDRVEEQFGIPEDELAGFDQEGPLASDPESAFDDEEELAGVDVEPMMMDGAGEAMSELAEATVANPPQMKDLEALRKKLAEPIKLPVCAVCGGEPEVSHPDGRGNQIHYCGIHEPREQVDEVYDTSERPEGVVRKRL